MEAMEPKDLNDVFGTPEAGIIWMWDGDLERALSFVRGHESEWLLERGILVTEDETMPGVSNLIEGDIVYRCTTHSRIGEESDPREHLFDWSLVDPLTGRIQARAFRTGREVR
jgi:hypothetical protein